MIDDIGVYNFRRLSQTLTTSGQPTGKQFAEMAADGVHTVINLAPSDSPKALSKQGELLRGLGLRYIHIPVDFAGPQESDLERFSDEMDSLGDIPVHIHCIANYRVSAFLYRYRRERLGWTEERARPDLDALWQPEGVWAEFISRQ